ncbi:MAG: hypothetical protein RBR71_05275 [Gudongella sp.]|nr:hypothetical protein [Gudongella sp.]
MDIKSTIQDLLNKVMKDDDLKSKFLDDPVKTVKSLIGDDLPNDQIKAIADGVMSKIGMDKAGDAFNNIKKMF